MDKYMKLICDKALSGINNKEGGPFGALIKDNNGNIIAIENNQVLKNSDPTAHAEIMVIRSACKKLNTIDLKGFSLYTTCEPCPMCLSAIIWANIDKVYYGANKKDAENIGFRDNMIYEYLNGKNKDLIELVELDRNDCIKIMNKYNNTIY